MHVALPQFWTSWVEFGKDSHTAHISKTAWFVNEQTQIYAGISETAAGIYEKCC